MVRIAAETKKGKKADPVTSRYFLTSIISWYNEDGIKCGIERVSDPFENKQDNRKAGVAVTLSILDNMPKCRAREIDDNGEVVKEMDEFTGEERDKIVQIEDPQEVTFFFNINVEEGEDEEFKVYSLSSAYPLFNHCFIEDGLLPQGNDKNIVFTIDELKESLVGKEFYAFAESRRFKGGKPYPVLLPQSVPAK